MLFHSTVMLTMQGYFLNKGMYNFIYKKNNQTKNPNHQNLKALITGFIMQFVSVDFIICLLWSLVLNSSVKV